MFGTDVFKKEYPAIDWAMVVWLLVSLGGLAAFILIPIFCDPDTPVVAYVITAIASSLFFAIFLCAAGSRFFRRKELREAAIAYRDEWKGGIHAPIVFCLDVDLLQNADTAKHFCWGVYLDADIVRNVFVALAKVDCDFEPTGKEFSPLTVVWIRPFGKIKIEHNGKMVVVKGKAKNNHTIEISCFREETMFQLLRHELAHLVLFEHCPAFSEDQHHMYMRDAGIC